MNIQNDVIGLVLRENCKSKQMTDFIAWPSRCQLVDFVGVYLKHCTHFDPEYVPFFAITIRPFSYSYHITGFSTRVTRRVPLVEK